MMKNNAVWSLLLLVVAVAALAMPLRGSETAPVISAPVQAAPPVASPAAPEKDPGVEAELPDVFNPQPNFVCLTGWCSSNSQCEQWFGPGWICQKQQGATCGHCIELQ